MLTLLGTCKLCRWYGEERGIEKRDVLFEKVAMS
jgi:hypothetical protein